MHPHHVGRAIIAAASGSAVAVFAETLNRSQHIAHEIEHEAPKELLERVSRLNGAHRIDFHGGGSIRFMSTRQSVRGLKLDHVFVPVGTDRNFLADIVPALCTSSEGVLTGY